MGNWIRGRHYKRAYLATALRRGKERVSWSDKTVQEILADAERRATRDAVDWRGNPIGDA